MILRLRYIQRFRDRHGKVRLYLRRKGQTPIALPDEADPGFLAAYQAALASMQPRKPVDRVLPGSFADLVRTYYTSAHFRNTLGDSTRAVYRRIIDGIVREHGDKPVALLDQQGVENLIEEKLDTPAAANHLLRSLRALVKHAIRRKLLLKDPTIGVERLKEAGEGAETWSEEDIAAFEARWPIGSRPRLALGLLLYTGQRRSDVVRMGRQHVKGGIIEVRQVKTGTRLYIPIHPDLAAMLARETDRLTYLMTGKGAPFTGNGFYNQFSKWAEEAGLPKGRSPHGLRKATARRLAEAGCSANQIQAITGHRKLSDLQVYTRDADQKRMAIDALPHLGRPQIVNESVNPDQDQVSNQDLKR